MASKGNRGKKELIHPIFLECKEHVENTFWKSLFEEFAFGKYPKQLYINQQLQIQSTNRSHFFQYSLKGKSIPDMVSEVQYVIMKHTSLISNEEILIKKNEHQPYKKETWNNWRDIKKKYIREILLMEYCIQIKNDYKLTMEQILPLYHNLSYATLYDIKLIDNKINHIPGISFDRETKEFTIQNELEEKSESLIEAPDMITNYCKRYMLRMAKSREDKEEEEEE